MIQRLTYALLSSIAIVFILIIGKDLLIPFIFSVLLWFVVRQAKKRMDRVPFLKKWLPGWTKTLITFILITLLAIGASSIIMSSVNGILISYEKYRGNVNSVLEGINSRWNIDIVEYITANAEQLDMAKILGGIVEAISSILGNTFIILIYSLFIFLEEAHFERKLGLLITDKKRYNEFSGVMAKIESSVSKYLGLKTLVSLITGTLSLLALWIIGVDSAFFWAFLIFLLNYIPTIGSLVATLFPTIFALLQFGNPILSLAVLVSVGIIQVLVGNILEPKMMGNSMNVSSLVTILALSFWGSIWGITGMVLSIPITVIILIICSHFPSTKSIAIFLSEKGDI